MKKVGFLVFLGTVVLGIAVASAVGWGRSTTRFFNFSIDIGGERGSGNVTEQTREVGEFKAIDVSGVFIVEVVAQKDFSVRVESDDNLLEYITTEVNDGVLEISTSKRIKPSNGMKIRISAPDIEKLGISGVAKVSMSDLKNKGLEVESSGASKLELSGETDKLVIGVSGASKINAENLKARSASIDSSGASKIDVHATESVRVEASGASKITYTGGATDVVKNTSGASSVKAK